MSTKKIKDRIWGATVSDLGIVLPDAPRTRDGYFDSAERNRVLYKRRAWVCKVTLGVIMEEQGRKALTLEDYEALETAFNILERMAEGGK